MRMGIGLGVGINRSNYAQGIFNAYSARVVADGGVVESGTCVDAVSSLLQSASLLLIPSGYKGGKAYAEIPTNGNGDLTWTRGSDAFRTNASGLIQRVPWNLLQRSEELDNAVWIKSACSVTANTTTAPNGTTTADKIVENSAVSSKFIYPSSVTSQTGTVYTYSIYAKASERSWVIIGQDQSGTGYFWVDLTNGVFGATSGTYVSRSLQSVGNGWYRISITYSAISSSSVGVTFISSGNSVVSYQGDGTSGVLVWGAQLVEGTTAQTYLPTTDRLNFPRLSYMYGSCPALLLEPQRTNLCLYSAQFDDATWVKNGTTVTANTTTSPDGSTNADTLSGDGSLGLHELRQSINFVSGTTYTLSVYAKKNTNNFIQLIAGSTGFGLNVWANFDLNSGVVGSVGSSTTASIQSIGNGWYRCIITGTASMTGSTLVVPYLVSSASSVRGETNTLATSLYLYGFQVEAGAYPTTYIPTTSATATRVADSFSRSNIYTNGLISASGGTWFVELRNNVAYTRDGINGIFIGDSTTPNSGNQFIIRNAGGLARLSVVNYVASTLTSVYTTSADIVKLAIKWNGSTADIFANGTKVVSATSFTPTNMENLIGNGGSVPTFIQQMALFPTPLSDTDCTTLTTL